MTAPLVPEGTMAALATMVPNGSFRLDEPGGLVGVNALGDKTERYLSAPGGVAVNSERKRRPSTECHTALQL